MAGLALLAGAALFVYKRRKAARLAVADSKGEKIDASKAPTTLIISSGGKLANTTTGTGSSKLASGLSTVEEGTEQGSSITPTSADWRCLGTGRQRGQRSACWLIHARFACPLSVQNSPSCVQL